MTDVALKYGFELVTMEASERLDIIDLVAARKAVKRLMHDARDVYKELSDPAFKAKWVAATKDRAERRSTKNVEQAREHQERLDYFHTPEGKAELAARSKIKSELPKDKRAKALKIAEALEVTAAVGKIFDTVRVAGRKIGDVHYRELDDLRKTGIFEGALCDQILRHVRPNRTSQTVREIINADTLRDFVATANGLVKKIEREGAETVVSSKKWAWSVHA